MADDRHDPIDPKHELRERELRPEHELPWPEESDPAKVGEQFADPNSADDRRVGKSFEETNASGKRPKTPLSERVHAPKNRRPLYWFLLAFLVLFVIVILVGWLPRHVRDKDIEKRAQAEKSA